MFFSEQPFSIKRFVLRSVSCCMHVVPFVSQRMLSEVDAASRRAAQTRPTVYVAWRTVLPWELCCPFFQVSAREMLVEEVFGHLLVTVVSTLHVRASGHLLCFYPGTSRVTVRRLWMLMVACSSLFVPMRCTDVCWATFVSVVWAFTAPD